MITNNKVFNGCAYALMALLVIACLVPFWLLFASSFTDESVLLLQGYSLFPRQLSLSTYQYLWAARSGVLRAYLMSIIITTIGVSANVTLTTLFAYPLSRKDLPGRGVLAFIIFFTMLFNGGLVPTYMVYTRMVGLQDTIWAMIVPNLLMNAFYIIMMRSYINSNISDEIIESARIDGANELRCLTSIVLPMCKPIIGTLALMSLIAYWNNWTNGMYYIQTRRELLGIQNYLMTVLNSSQALQAQASQGLVDIKKVPSVSLRMALAVVAVIPVLIMYPFFQKSFVKGITLGSVKG